ncbi:MAG: alpha/beta fold hydrolase [Parvularculaceae bacterium]
MSRITRMAPVYAIALVLGMLLIGGCASWRAEKNAPPIGAFIEVDGERIHVLDIGPKESALPPVVLIHGASVNLRDMKLALGDELAKTRRVLLIDRPGRGYSSRPHDGWKLDRQAELIHGAVEALGVQRPIVLGQSFGGAVALSYALHYQDEMSGLVLLAPVSHEWPGGVAWYNRLSGWPVAGVLFRRLVIPVYAPLAAKGSVLKSFAPDAAPEGYYENAGVSLLFRAKDFRSNAEDLRKLKPQIVAMSGRYGEIRIPAAVLTGDRDPTVSPKIHSAALAREIPGVYAEVLEGAGHALHHSRTARILAAVERISGAAAAESGRSAVSAR